MLSDGTRMRLLALLEREELTVAELAAPGDSQTVQSAERKRVLDFRRGKLPFRREVGEMLRRIVADCRKAKAILGEHCHRPVTLDRPCPF